MIKINHTELAWAAGFFDGEGCTYLGRTNNVMLEISQKELVPLERFHNIIKVGRVRLYRHRRLDGQYDKMINKLSVTSFEHVQYIMAMLWKYLCPIKRQQWRRATTTHISTCVKNNYSMNESAIHSRDFRKNGTKAMQNKRFLHNLQKRIEPQQKKIEEFEIIEVQ